MPSAAEFQAKVGKTVTNMDRLDGIVNGGTTVEVSTDNGLVPSIAKVIKDAQDTLSGALENVENATDDATTAAALAEAKAALANTAAALTTAATAAANLAKEQADAATVTALAAAGNTQPTSYDFTATAGQPSVTLPFSLTIAPIVYLNGVRLAVSEFSYSGAVVTFGSVLRAGDKVTITVGEAALIPHTTIDRVGGLAEILGEIATSPLKYGAVGDGEADDTDALEELLGSVDRVINWGGPDRVYRVTRMITEARPNARWIGSATLKLDRTGHRICPLFNLASTATDFWGDPDLVFDHNAEGVDVPDLANQPAFALCSAIILQAKGFQFSCRVKNSFDNGVSVIRASWTGDGETTPYNLTQVTSQPQGWSIGTIYGENCGCGDHGGAFGEFGKKGAPFNNLTGSDGSVGAIVGVECYNGVIVDFGGGAEANIALATFTGTKVDPDYPTNGSGIDCYIGSGPASIGSLKSDNAGRMGLAITPNAGSVNINARIHAAAHEGAVIEGGNVTGTISVSAASQASNGGYDALVIKANTSNVSLNLMATVIAAPSGNKHRYAYATSKTGSYNAKGSVILVGDIGTAAAIYNRNTAEVLDYRGSDATAIFGRVGFKTEPVPSSTSAIFSGGDISLAEPNSSVFFNLYFEELTSTWHYCKNGYGALLKQYVTDGHVEIQYAPNNTAGPGALATLQPMVSFLPSAKSIFGLSDYADDTAAAAGSLPVSALYRTGSTLKIRVA